MNRTRIVSFVGWTLAGAALFACSSQGGEEERSPSGRTAQALSACEHPLCSTGGPLTRACDTCTVALCALDPYCCDVAWDATCVGEVTSICGQSCTSAPPAADAGASSCAHPICATGGPLISGCEPCAAQVCAQDPYCCNVAWDGTCVNEVTSICGTSCN